MDQPERKQGVATQRQHAADGAKTHSLERIHHQPRRSAGLAEYQWIPTKMAVDPFQARAGIEGNAAREATIRPEVRRVIGMDHVERRVNGKQSAGAQITCYFAHHCGRVRHVLEYVEADDDIE